MTTTATVYRIEVRPKPDMPDPVGESAHRDAATLGLTCAPRRIDAASIYLIAGQLSDNDLHRIAGELLADPVTQQASIGATPTAADATIEVHPLPGVMDPDADPIRLAVSAMLDKHVEVRTGRRYDMHGVDQHHAEHIADRCLANRVIHAVTGKPYHPDAFPAGAPYELAIIDVPLRGLDDAALETLSRDAHLFLSLEEMRTIQAHYESLGREPLEIELETLAQTWSEHCVHKTLKATVRYQQAQPTDAADDPLPIAALINRPGHVRNDDGSVTINNLLRSTVAAATNELMADGIDWCLSVFVDNAGVIAFDDKYAVCFKVETHNHPSAIEPYGGAATGIGGCIRDIIGTGLAAKPIANTDTFCVAHPDAFTTNAFTTESTEDTERKESGDGQAIDVNTSPLSRGSVPAVNSVVNTSGGSVMNPLPAGCLHPRRILQQVVAGVRDYGNRMGIPTLNGAVWFHNDYVGNPLVYAGCVGVMPREFVHGDPQAGDHIIALGGRTGRDGIHGATFSSAELTDTHADEFSHAVQIGNPVEEKKVLDAILHARDHADGCLYNAITDCGAGGFSSAVGEMGEKLGATVHLDRAPLKYDGLSATEIWISEAQERMVLSVPQGRLDKLAAICATHDVELCDLGTFGTPNAELILNYDGVEVGRLDMQFMHEGLPDTQREAMWTATSAPGRDAQRQSANDSRPSAATEVSVKDALCTLLAHPNIASKHWIIRQYDHEVQGATAIKPLAGPRGIGPSDASVITPVDGSSRGLAIANGLATGLADDPYLMTLAAIDECVRNLVCVGCDPERVAILDNFCWPSCNDEQSLGSLVRAAEACYDGAKAYRTPFISGKDSLNNQFTTEAGETIRIPPTMLISGFGIVDDVSDCVTMDAKAPGSVLVFVGGTQPHVRGSHLEMCFGQVDQSEQATKLPRVDLEFGPTVARCVHQLIKRGVVRAAHDCSDGGFVVAAAEMCIASGLGLDMHGFASHLEQYPINHLKACFGEGPSSYLLEMSAEDAETVLPSLIAEMGLPEYTSCVLGTFTDQAHLRIGSLLDVPIAKLENVWRGTLDW